jgi:DNA polymerase I
MSSHDKKSTSKKSTAESKKVKKPEDPKQSNLMDMMGGIGGSKPAAVPKKAVITQLDVSINKKEEASKSVIAPKSETLADTKNISKDKKEVEEKTREIQPPTVPQLKQTTPEKPAINTVEKPVISAVEKPAISTVQKPAISTVQKPETKISSKIDAGIEEKKKFETKIEKPKEIPKAVSTTPLKKSELKFYKKDPTPFGELAFPVQLKEQQRGESHKSRYLRLLIENGLICSNMKNGLLLTVDYDGAQNKAYAQFYDLDDKKIKFWIDNTDHRAYCIHKDPKAKLEQNQKLMSFSGYAGIETIKKYDLLEDKEIEVSKIYATTPNLVGGQNENNIKAILEGAWEANIRYHHNYIYDRQLIPGLIYRIKNGNIEPVDFDLKPEIVKELSDLYKTEKKDFQEMARKYLKIFSYPIPDIRRVAFDIEVNVRKENSLPDTKLAKEEVIAVSFASNDGLKKVYVLWREDAPIGYKHLDITGDAEIIFFESEKELLMETFRIIWDYPVVLSFNGDNFDLNYLFHRASNLKIAGELNPIHIARGGGLLVDSYAHLRYGIHIDLYQVFANRSLKIYAFGGGYDRNSLDEISKKFCETAKFKHETGEKFSAADIKNMDLHTLAHYNMIDSIVTLELSTFEENTVWNLLVYLMRITKMPLQDLFRHQISAWIKSLMFFEHRANNYLISRESEIAAKKPSTFVQQTAIEGKGFQGAYVIPPIPGIHFDVVVTDFASLYPSIIKTRNLSYETINCGHPECESNMLPGTPYYACTRRVGIFALVVGFFRDIRIKWFKPRSSDKKIPDSERKFAKIIQSALKVFINGSYGVFGSPQFPMYCLPVAEATTAIGRFAIKSTIDKAESMGIKVLYGDTDSVFMLHPTDEQVKKIIEWSEKQLGIDLEKDKIYQFLALSDRKKNYVGIYKGTHSIDIKGMTGKKSNTPPFIKTAFSEVTEMLKQITNQDEFIKIKKDIMASIRSYMKKIGKTEEEGGIPIDQYAISMVMTKAVDKYDNKSQHVKAAIMAQESDDEEIEAGDVISFVKTTGAEGVKPLSLATIRDVDKKKYIELLKGTVEQILDALGIDFSEIEGATKIDSFFGAKK